jgi:hypothetical protein
MRGIRRDCSGESFVGQRLGIDREIDGADEGMGRSTDDAAQNLAMELQPEVGGNTARNQKRTLGQMQDLAQGLASYLVVLLNRLT